MNKPCLQSHRISTDFCAHHHSWSSQDQTGHLRTMYCADWMISGLMPIPLLFTAFQLHTMPSSLAALPPVLKRPLYNLRSISDQCHLSLRRGDATCIIRFHQLKIYCYRTSKLQCRCLLLTYTSNIDLGTQLQLQFRAIYPSLRKDLGLGKPVSRLCHIDGQQWVHSFALGANSQSLWWEPVPVSIKKLFSSATLWLKLCRSEAPISISRS